MQMLDEIIDFYLTTNTNYAIMITGEWGIGKTYYFKNSLRKQISNTSTYHDDQRKYKPLLISLFGLKSIEEIQTEILLCLYPLLKNKSIKLGASIGKSLIKGIMHLTNLGQIYEYVTETEIDKGDWIKFSELVICFDDFERLSPNLNIEELIGYINTLVENENVKILIIANENKINEDNYFLLKEKIVGNSIEFVPDTKVSYRNLIKTKFSGSNIYINFLITNEEFILNIFKNHSSNLRIFSFALTYFQKIFSSVKDTLPSHVVLQEKENEILLKLIKFTLLISLEYKEGKISLTKRRDLDTLNTIDLAIFAFTNSSKQIEEEKTYREKVIEKYYKEDTYTYFESIYTFLTGGAILKIDNLLQELNQNYHIEEDKIAPQYIVFNQLSYPSVFSLNEKEYNHLTKQMLIFCDSGIYEITSYATIFYYATRFKNPLKYNFLKLETRIINGMKKGQSRYSYTPALDFYISINSESDNKENLLRIKSATLEINKKIEMKSKLVELIRLETLCLNNFELFYNEILNKENSLAQVSIFQSFNVHKFYLFFIKSSNEQKWKIVCFFEARYTEYPSQELKQEIPFLEKLKIKILTKNSSKSGLTNFILDELNSALVRSISKLEIR